MGLRIGCGLGGGESQAMIRTELDSVLNLYLYRFAFQIFTLWLLAWIP